MASSVRVPMFVVDAFTPVPFGGNPAGVCLLLDPSSPKLTDAQMVKIAAEMKHSETAFVAPVDAAKGVYSLRWFTPVTEVKLCGHATLATAHALFEEVKLPKETKLTFQTLSGDLFVTKDADTGRLQMNFPTSEASPNELADEIIAEMCAALTLPTKAVRRTYFEPKSGKLFVEVDSLAAIHGIKPNSDALMAVKYSINVRGISVFTTNMVGSKLEGQGFDVASRYFAPWVGLHEDPVNGSSHTILGPLMSARFGKQQLLAYMASERTGVLGLNVLNGGRILLEGEAQTTLSGSQLVPK